MVRLRVGRCGVVRLWSWAGCSHSTGTCLVVQWLRLQGPNVEGPGSIPGQGTKSHVLKLRPCESESVHCSVVTNSLQPHELNVAHQTPLSMGFSRQEY